MHSAWQIRLSLNARRGQACRASDEAIWRSHSPTTCRHCCCRSSAAARMLACMLSPKSLHIASCRPDTCAGACLYNTSLPGPHLKAPAAAKSCCARVCCMPRSRVTPPERVHACGPPRSRNASQWLALAHFSLPLQILHAPPPNAWLQRRADTLLWRNLRPHVHSTTASQTILVSKDHVCAWSFRAATRSRRAEIPT